MFRAGMRTFTIASLLTVLIGVLHTLGLANDPPNETWAEAYDAARAATLQAGAFSMSLYDTFVGVWIQVGAMLVMLGIKNLIVVTAVPAASKFRVVQRLAGFDCVCFTLLTILFVYFEIPPPLVSFAVLTLLFATAAVFSRNAASGQRGAPS